MNKSDLIKIVASEADVPDCAAKVIVDTILASVVETLAKGQAMTVAGLGTFVVKARAARLGRNPHTGQQLEIPAVNRPVFRPGKALKDAVQ